MSCDGKCKKLKDELMVYSNSLIYSDNENKELKKSLDGVSDTLNKSYALLNKSYAFISMLETRLANLEYLLGEANKDRDIAHTKYTHEFDKNIILQDEINNMQKKIDELIYENDELKNRR